MIWRDNINKYTFHHTLFEIKGYNIAYRRVNN